MRSNLKFFFVSLLSLFFFINADGQENRQLTKLPIDPAVRYGKLSNGMTYYIRHNAIPENQADFYIAQKVGSMQEEDSQRGLAHFLEHMAFNGTENFPGRKTMLNYLEKNGVQFGSNVNAYTSFDETVYNITNVPMAREGLLDSCLLILRDWSGYLTLENSEIDQERKIIKEEWRTRNGANIRVMEKILPVLFEGSKYAYRMPIGIMEVVEHFDYQELKDYYHKWYRPDLQGIVIVGDIDVDAVEAKVKKMFSEIPMPVNAAERVYSAIPDNKEPVVAIATDPELSSTSISLYFKEDMPSKEFKQSEEGVFRSILDAFVSSILSSRYREISQKKDAPFLGAYVSKEDFIVSKNKLAWTVGAGCKEGEIVPALEALIRETERAQRFGFLSSEVERAKIALLQSYENAYNNKDKRETGELTGIYVNSFIEDTPISGIEYEYELLKKMLPKIDANLLNAYVKGVNLSEKLSIIVMGPEKKDLVYPTADSLIATIAKVKQESLDPYNEELSDEPLISQLPEKGKIVKEEATKFDTKTWTLSNGVKVVLKNTDFKDDEISISSYSYGGISLFDDNEIFNASVVSSVVPLGGLGNFNDVDLDKKLAGKSVSVSTSITGITQGISAGSNKRDIETALQLIYLSYTAPRYDVEAFETYIERAKNKLKNQDLLPNTSFGDSINQIMYGDNLRMKRMKLADVDSLDYDRIFAMYKECFEQGAAPVFVFVGTLDEDVLRPLAEQYLATLPVGDANRKYIDRSIRVKSGNNVVRFKKEMETPMTSVFNLHSADLDYNQKNNITLAVLNQVLDLVYTRTIREEEGGTYGVGTSVGMSRRPLGETMLYISYTTDESKVEKLNKIAYDEIEKIATNGPDQEDFDKTIEFMKKSYQEAIKQNDYWMSTIYTYNLYDEDNHSSYLEYVNTLKPEDVKLIARKILDAKNYKEVIMFPQ